MRIKITFFIAMWEERETLVRPGLGQKSQLVVYALQSSMRIQDNWTLKAAMERARKESLPLVVIFGLDPSFPGANLRSFDFLWKGLVQVFREMRTLGIQTEVFQGSLLWGLKALKSLSPWVYLDKGYLDYHNQIREQIPQDWPSPVIQIEDNALIPVGVVSPKLEYSAATLRRKYLPLMGFFTPKPWEIDSLPPRSSLDIKSVMEKFGLKVLPSEGPFPLLSSVDTTVRPVEDLPMGESGGHEVWTRFLNQGLENYALNRNDPGKMGQSGLSPYLHFGQISPITLARDLVSRGGDGPEAFSEELFIRRELSLNYVTYNRSYKEFSGLPSWAQKTLEVHSTDKREYLYTGAQWENAQTHDPAWNAAQTELKNTGKIHGYMRMYWGKKILEWSESPRHAWKIAIELNDKYSLDGRDPNGYAGVGWCFGLHDRPWSERPVYGMIRSMVYSGLKRKFDIEGYIAKQLDKPYGLF